VEKDLACFVVDKYEELHSERSNFQNLWDEVLELFLPRKSFVFTKNNAQGEKRTSNIFSSRGMQAAEMFANAMHTMLTNPTVQFMEYYSGFPDIDIDVDAKRFFDARTEIVHNILNSSNFQTEIHECYFDLATLGTDILRTEEDDVDVVRFESRPVFEYVLEENPRGLIDQLGREKQYTGIQLLRKFGESWIYDSFEGEAKQSLGDEYKRKLANGPSTEKHDVIEFIMPKEVYKIQEIETINRNHVMAIVMKKDKKLIKQEGYNEEIYSCSRLMKSSHEVYGRSHAMKSLPSMLTLNELRKMYLQAGQLGLKPPVMVTDDGTYPGFKIYPGAINYTRPGTERPTPFNSGVRIDISRELMIDVGEEIDKNFMLDKLELPSFQRATTAEVQAKRDEDLRLLSPMLARQHYEKLIPLIRRVDAICRRKGLFTGLKVPDIIKRKSEELGEDITLSIKYSSAIARVQKNVLGDNANKWLGSLQLASQMNPEVLDNVNFDNFTKYQAFSFSAPSALLRGSEEVSAIRKDREEKQAEQMEQQMALMQAQTASQSAKAAKDVGGLAGEEAI
jgi:hypothetical protein